jgi:hypothetical protein
MGVIGLQAERWMDCWLSCYPEPAIASPDLRPHLGIDQQSAHAPGFGARLRTVSELYPEIVDAAVGEDPLPSCSAIEALDRQEPFINQTLASSALAMLARLNTFGGLRNTDTLGVAQQSRSLVQAGEYLATLEATPLNTGRSNTLFSASLQVV